MYSYTTKQTGYTRALVPTEGFTYMEWLGKESDETPIPDEDEEGDGTTPGKEDTEDPLA